MKRNTQKTVNSNSAKVQLKGKFVSTQEDLWPLAKVFRFAKIYNKRLLNKRTKSREEQVAFFNYILKMWDDLHCEGKVRVVPREASQWYQHKDDSIFKVADGQPLTSN